MNRSQLRLLAEDFAEGRIDQATYRQQRDALLDAITSGAIPIERVAPPPPPPPPPKPAAAPAGTASPEPEPVEPEETGGFSPIPILLGAVIVVGLIWFIMPGGVEESPPATGSMPAAGLPEMSPVEQSLDRLLTNADWSNTALDQFRAEWNGLTPADRQAARASKIFPQVIAAIGQEINAQRALAQLDDTGNAKRHAEQLQSVANAIESGNMAPLAPAADSADTADKQSTAPPPAANQMPTPQKVTAALLPELPALPPASPLSVHDWLAAQGRERYTLQIFALGRLDNVERLLADYPELKLKVLDSPGATPRYRVLHGSFESAESALAAHRKMPVRITREQPKPVVKSFGELLAMSAGTTTAKAGNATWLAQQNAENFTLQLFALNNLDNVNQLQARHPELSLYVHAAIDSASRYRVLYGSFPAAEAAKEAFHGLPKDVIAAAGSPVVKTIAEVRSIR